MGASFAAVTGEHPIEPSVQIVLFDLGGVLLEVGGVAPMRELSGIDTDEELWARWLGCRWVQQLEAGRCSPEEFAAGVVADWELPVSPAEFLATFGGWVNQPYPGRARTGGRDRRPRRGSGASATRTRSSGTRTSGRLPLIGVVRVPLPLLRAGTRQAGPAPSSRPWRPGCPPSPDRVLFLDDNAVNVEAAAAYGFRPATCAVSARRAGPWSSGRAGRLIDRPAATAHGAAAAARRAPGARPVPTCRHGRQRSDAASPAAPQRRRRLLLDVGRGRGAPSAALSRLRVLHPPARPGVPALPVARPRSRGGERAGPRRDVHRQLPAVDPRQ